MSAAAMRGMVRRLGPSADPPLDADLVTAFAARRDADAFAALVDRHGPTVLGVCRRLLGDARTRPRTPSRLCFSCSPRR